MDRRSILVSAAALLAGCGIRGGRGEVRTETATATGTPTPNPTATNAPTESRYRPAEVRLRIETARERLAAATTTFETEFEDVALTSRSPQFDRTAVTSRIDEVRDDLRATDDVATPEQRRILGSLQDYIEFLHRLLDATGTFIESLRARPPAIALEYGSRHAEAEKSLERARSRLKQTVDELELARVGFRTAKSKLVEPDAVGVATARGLLDRIDGLVSDFRTIYDGDFELERGWSDYGRGLEDYRNDNDWVAVSSFRKAEIHFLKAENVYASGQPDAMREVSGLFDYRLCQSRRYAKAADHMQYAPRLQEHSPEKADEYVEAAVTTYNRVDEECDS